MISSICIIGAGTMGSSIAQVAAQNGFTTLLFDTNNDVLEKAKLSIKNNLHYLMDKQKITATEKENIYRRISFTHQINFCKADVIIEAIAEKLQAKIDLFTNLAGLNNSQTIFASNTSSLSISALQAPIIYPQRVVGMHFFNPATVMKLVEVVKGNQTCNEVVQTIFNLCAQLNKTPVLCKDAPGFIVNRVARPYYLQALKLVEQGNASIENIDEIMEATGFKMGPFKLMDLIGLDVNLAVSQTIYASFNNEPRLAPSALQISKVAMGELGKKTGKGFYDYPIIK